MKNKAILILTACLCAAAWRHAPGGAVAAAPGPADQFNYEAACEVISADLVEGHVMNRGPDSWLISGYVRFIIESPGTAQRKEIGLNASALVPAGQRVRVAWTGLPFSIKKPEVCRFDVSGAIRKP